ncbi:immunoglobulin domain-containing protein [Flavobacterium aquicola]|uniref:Ig-like domain-containing protein n=1 Tax=Flavobacterium aquicola TaxID=1682742 RepID=A0A3E0DYH2_9FLAO|nr:hypothetical protein [Flavobacterium aquicola]REG91144.1 hypothetical protein C8P67_11738 [Flavobacterium aquicola]
MKKTLPILLLSIFTLSLFSCSTNEAITCYLPDNVISSNSPLVPGGTLNLKAVSTANMDVSYSWSGPNNFQSSLQNPIITNITPAMSGEYKLKTIKGICESSESSVAVEIIAPDIPCNPDANTLVFENDMFSQLDFSTYTTNYNQNFKILSSSLRGSLTIEFASEERPVPGIYSICGECPTSFLKKDQVCVSLNFADYTHAQEGLVYLSSSNGKLTAVFCNVVFSQSVFTFKTSAKITEN